MWSPSPAEASLLPVLTFLLLTSTNSEDPQREGADGGPALQLHLSRQQLWAHAPAPANPGPPLSSVLYRIRSHRSQDLHCKFRPSQAVIPLSTGIIVVWLGWYFPCILYHPVSQFALVFFLLFFFFRAQTTVWWRFGLRSTADSTRRCGATRPRSRTWRLITRTRWLRPEAVTRPFACGAFVPAPLWLCCRDTVGPLPPYRYIVLCCCAIISPVLVILRQFSAENGSWCLIESTKIMMWGPKKMSNRWNEWKTQYF